MAAYFDPTTKQVLDDSGKNLGTYSQGMDMSKYNVPSIQAPSLNNAPIANYQQQFAPKQFTTPGNFKQGLISPQEAQYLTALQGTGKEGISKAVSYLFDKFDPSKQLDNQIKQQTYDKNNANAQFDMMNNANKADQLNSQYDQNGNYIGAKGDVFINGNRMPSSGYYQNFIQKYGGGQSANQPTAQQPAMNTQATPASDPNTMSDQELFALYKSLGN